MKYNSVNQDIGRAHRTSVAVRCSLPRERTAREQLTWIEDSCDWRRHVKRAFSGKCGGGRVPIEIIEVDVDDMRTNDIELAENMVFPHRQHQGSMDSSFTSRGYAAYRFHHAVPYRSSRIIPDKLIRPRARMWEARDVSETELLQCKAPVMWTISPSWNTTESRISYPDTSERWR
ncbi:hypothetical protein BKA93DRAFT_796738 [Sparassis latifolia]